MNPSSVAPFAFRPLLQIHHFLHPGDLVFEIGASLGGRTAPLLETGATVLSVERQPECAAFLAERFSGHPNLRLVSAPPGADQAADVGEPASGPVVCLDELVRAYGRPRFCRLDVDRATLATLRTLTQPVPFLSFGFSGQRLSEVRDTVGYLLWMGYEQFNLTQDDWDGMVSSQWLTVDFLFDYLDVMSGPLLHGDIFAAARGATASPAASLGFRARAVTAPVGLAPVSEVVSAGAGVRVVSHEHEPD